MPRVGLRWRGFRRVYRTVCKRVDRRITELGLDGYDAYRDYLERHAAEWRRFDELCRIPISRFYRDRAVFDALRASIVQELAGAAQTRGDHFVRVWCAGCASGEEVYSLAMLWMFEQQEKFQPMTLDILGTDAEPTMIERARAATYKLSSVKELPAQWRRDGFDPCGQQLQVKLFLRRMPRWAVQDIRQKTPNEPFDLVLCRNAAFTYFDDRTQRLVLQHIAHRMAEGGILVVGGHELLPAAGPFSQPVTSLPIYRLAPSDQMRCDATPALVER